MRFSWIITVISVYFLSVLIYCLQDDKGNFWNNYFWVDTSLICISGWLFNFIPKKSDFEMAFILFVIFVKLFNLLYYIIGLSLDKTVWMSTNVFFLCAMAVSGFIGMIFLRYRAWKRSL